MHKEFFKTAFLTFLVCLSVVLAFNIWFDKELWSYGYSSFVYSFENIFPALKKDVYIENSAEFYDSEYGIEWFFASEGSRKCVIYFGDGEFSKYLSELREIRSSITKSGTVSQVSKEDFTNAFKSASVAFKLNTPAVLSKYFMQDENWFEDISPVCDLVLITTAKDNSSVKYIYFEDSSQQLCYKMPVKYNNGQLLSIISNSISQRRISDSYAFELNFDKPSGEISRILFDSFIPITTETKSMYKAQCVPYTYNSQNSYDAVFKAFEIRKNSARTYKDTDNVLNYIGNYSSLKIYSDGRFCYEADSPSKGINMGSSDTAEAVLKFANSLYKSMTQSEAMLILKDVKKNDDGSSTYGLIYGGGGMPVYLPDTYGAEITVKDGNIVKYSQTLIEFSKSEDAFFSGTVIEAYDALYNTDIKKEKSDLKITELIPVNYYENGTVVPKWYIKFSDGSFYFL